MAFTFWVLALCLVVGFVAMFATGFKSSRAVGYLLLGLYAAYLTLIGLYEYDVLRFGWLPFPDTYVVKPSITADRRAE